MQVAPGLLRRFAPRNDGLCFHHNKSCSKGRVASSVSSMMRNRSRRNCEAGRDRSGVAGGGCATRLRRSSGQSPDRRVGAARGRRVPLPQLLGKVAEGRMGCGKQGWFGEGSRRRSCNPPCAEAAGHTPSGASRHLPQQAGEGESSPPNSRCVKVVTLPLHPSPLHRRLRGEDRVVLDERDIGLETPAAGQFDHPLEQERRRLLLATPCAFASSTASAMRSSIIASSSA